MNAPIASPVSHAKIDLRALAFRRLDADGNELAADANEGHAITHFLDLGLMFDVRTPKVVESLKEAQEWAAQCDLLGRKGDWVIGEDVEVAALINRKFREPSVDPLVAPNMPSSEWIYTSTAVKGSSGHVWFVYLYYGDVYWDTGDNEGLAVPVLRVPASQ